MKIKILKNVIANVDGQSVKFKAGDVVDLRGEAAENLLRGGYAERANEPVTVITKRQRKAR
jgi:hypothetical protein